MLKKRDLLKKAKKVWGVKRPVVMTYTDLGDLLKGDAIIHPDGVAEIRISNRLRYNLNELWLTVLHEMGEVKFYNFERQLAKQLEMNGIFFSQELLRALFDNVIETLSVLLYEKTKDKIFGG